MTIPVLCIHGALRSSVGMWPTASWLRRAGFDARAWGYPTRRGSLAEHGQALGRFLERCHRGRPPPVQGFLTHSMGGLVVRSWLAQSDPATRSQRHRIVMLSPPNQGSQLARKHADNPLFRALYGKAAQTLASEEIESLPPLPPGCEVLILAGGTGGRGYNPALEGDDDGVVAVSEMGLPGVPPTFVGGWHAILQWKPALLTRAAAFLRTGQP